MGHRAIDIKVYAFELYSNYNLFSSKAYIRFSNKLFAKSNTQVLYKFWNKLFQFNYFINPSLHY